MLKKNTPNSFLIIFLFVSILWCSAQNNTASPSVSTFQIEAPQLKSTKKVWLYLPKGYGSSSKKYPVIYMHDGQNIFDAKTSFAVEWQVDEKLDSLSGKVIVVAIETTDQRMNELSPFENAKYGGGKAKAYLDFIVNTLKPRIDSEYRTKSNSQNTMMMGSSLGGLTTLYALLQYPDIFGKAAIFSPAFWFNRNEIVNTLKQTKDFKAKVYFMHGDNEGDPDMEPDMNQIEQIVNTKRCECKKRNKKVIVKGGQHNEKLWRDAFVKAYLWLK